MKRIIIALHLCGILIILADNAMVFQLLKTNSNYIKEKIGSVEFLRNLMSTVILDIDYRKPEIAVDEDCLESEDNSVRKTRMIGEIRARQQKVFFDHYRNNGSILSNTILLADVVHEFMKTKIDTLLLPFDGKEYCYNIMDTKWCQVQSIDLFTFPLVVRYVDYSPELYLSNYRLLKRSAKLTICGSNGVLFNLLFDNVVESKQNYYLFVYGNEVFISTGKLILSG